MINPQKGIDLFNNNSIITIIYFTVTIFQQRITQEVEDFLKGKGICMHEEDHSYIRLYGYEGSPFLLPTFFCDRYFVVELCRQYKTWSTIFYKKRKSQSISLPFNVAIVTIRSSSHLIKVSEMFNVFDLKEA
jgi:hypothetical protein